MEYATIFREDLEYLSRCILDYPDIETGGDFFGFWNNLGLPVIQYVSGPGRNSEHHVTFFRQDIGCLQAVGNTAFRHFGLQHIGSWHSHHQLGLAQPSSHDCQTMVNAINHNRLDHFFMILGNIRNGRTTINGFLFRKERQHHYIETQWRILEQANPFRSEIDHLLGGGYTPKTQRASIANLSAVEAATSAAIPLDFEPEKWLGSRKGREELNFVYRWLMKTLPSGETAKMYISNAKDLTIKATAFSVIFPNTFPDAYPVIMFDGKTLTDDGAFEYNNAQQIVDYLYEKINGRTPAAEAGKPVLLPTKAIRYKIILEYGWKRKTFKGKIGHAALLRYSNSAKPMAQQLQASKKA